MKCPYCQEEIQDAAVKCRFCGEILVKDAYDQMVGGQSDSVDGEQRAVEPGCCGHGTSEPHHRSRYADEDPYYQKVFRTYDAKDGRFGPNWNWSAFLLGWIWYFIKGMWAKALMLMGVCLVTWGFGFVLAWVYAGLFGNFDYYLLKTRKTQLWK